MPAEGATVAVTAHRKHGMGGWLAQKVMVIEESNRVGYLVFFLTIIPLDYAADVLVEIDDCIACSICSIFSND